LISTSDNKALKDNGQAQREWIAKQEILRLRQQDGPLQPDTKILEIGGWQWRVYCWIEATSQRQL
jgi:hypothetical protein